jgi:hypothetical protein
MAYDSDEEFTYLKRAEGAMVLLTINRRLAARGDYKALEERRRP